MFSKETISEITTVARQRGLEPAALLAVADVESAGTAYALVAGKREPLIRFEGHYFDARLKGEARAIARADGLAHPRAGHIANPQTQAGRWRMLERAAVIQTQAAYESTSWGIGQVMGAHWRTLGYGSVEELVAEVRSSAAGQTRLMADFIIQTGLERTLREHNWPAFARGYNGPAYDRNHYDVRMAAAWSRYDKMLGHADSTPPLRSGATGKEVERLQAALNRHGYHLSIDGRFGRATRRAVITLQRRHGLRGDGVVGSETWRVLAAPAAEAQNFKALPRNIFHLRGFGP